MWWYRLHRVTRLLAVRLTHTGAETGSSAAPIPPPATADAHKEYDPKLHTIVQSIGNLTLLEVADLNDLLKVWLCRHVQYAQRKWTSVHSLGVAHTGPHWPTPCVHRASSARLATLAERCVVCILTIDCHVPRCVLACVSARAGNSPIDR
jgi:hypothetical protein